MVGGSVQGMRSAAAAFITSGSAIYSVIDATIPAQDAPQQQQQQEQLTVLCETTSHSIFRDQLNTLCGMIWLESINQSVHQVAQCKQGVCWLLLLFCTDSIIYTSVQNIYSSTYCILIWPIHPLAIKRTHQHGIYFFVFFMPYLKYIWTPCIPTDVQNKSSPITPLESTA